MYTPRSRVDQEHARRASSEAARNKGGSPKKQYLLSPPQSLLLITSNLFCNANDCPRSTATLPPIPPSPVLVRCCLFSQNGKCSRKQRVLRSFRSGCKVLASSVVFTADISPVPTLFDFHMCDLYRRRQVRNFSFTVNEFIPKLFCPRTHNDQVYQLQSHASN